jgi:protein SCO1/2
MTRARLLLPCLAWSLSAASWAAPLALPAPPEVAFAPQAGAPLPLDAVLLDEAGRPLPLGSLFGQVPVVLVPGYYTCRNLCTTMFVGVLQALALSGLPAGSYRLAGVSIDPDDTPARAAARKRAYAPMLPDGEAGLHLLSGGAGAARIGVALGYRSGRDPASGELAHAAGFVVATPDGRVARYFAGVRFDPAQLREAVRTAGRGRVVEGGFGDRLRLLCAHFNPASNVHGAAALWAVRAGALLLVLALGAGLWRLRPPGERP